MIKIKKSTRQYLFLLFILSLSFFLRFYRLQQNIPNLYSDELGHLNMLYLLHQPLHFSTLISRSFYYLSSFTWILGTTVFGIRSATAFFASLIPLFIFFFVKTLDKKDTSIALISAFLTSILPWSFMIGRGSHTHIPLVVIFVLLHLIFFIKATSLRHYLISLIPLALASVFYPSIIIISLLVIPFYAIYFYRQIKNKSQQRTIILAFLFFVSTVVVILFTKYNGLSQKSRGVSLIITNDINVTAETNLYRGYSQKSPPSIFSFALPTEKIANKLLYNFPSAVIRQFGENYFSFFSPDFLFFSGDYVLRHSTSQFGVLFPILSPFLVYGIFTFFSRASRKTQALLLLWLVVSPVPSAITNDGARYLLRAVTLLPILTYFSALGIVRFRSLFKHKLQPFISVIIFTLILFSAYSFFFGYFHVYPTLSARSYEYGFDQISDLQVDNNNHPLLVIWQGYYPNSYFRYYQQTDLDKYFNYQRKDIRVGESVFYQTFDNLYFSWPKSIDDLKMFLQDHQISLIAFPNDYLKNNPQYKPEHASATKQIFYPDNSLAFTIFTL